MMKKVWKLWKEEKGFTLVELLAVIVILAIIVAIAVPAVGNIIDRAEEGANEAEAELVENAARLAFLAAESGGDEADWVYDGGDSVNITVDELRTNNYLDVEEEDQPVGNIVHNGDSSFTFNQTTE
ncbi:prepilin-type N-terminal cleavage/methylation domain-containing protein [Gracilibacillus salinarum]|uniref:Prepilin-type N-terminal cleavage/methylation domain-containing protein n=1 Tax=Gracilibacillus salinarum TaxID=2932255 RepID=A0ABY4GR74_9BACI|nr:prepilin-type N-terminal cleavage/methylation domain-containing protein [Gracilibacillus salinarum]UOQ86162.1 prepilin-type N-terminal cleavage/methylation domain-containing protein [Gracilibacillus salinarum]